MQHIPKILPVSCLLTQSRLFPSLFGYFVPFHPSNFTIGNGLENHKFTLALLFMSLLLTQKLTESGNCNECESLEKSKTHKTPAETNIL